jgi:hypothetical protein
MAIRNRDHHRLGRAKPGRELSGVMLDQESGEALMAAQRGAVNDIDRLLVAIGGRVLKLKAFGRHEVELVGGDGVFGADHRLHHEVDFRAVERRLALDFLIRIAGLVHGLFEDVERRLPALGVIDIFVEVFHVRQGQAHPEIVDAEQAVIVRVHVHHVQELVLGLVGTAIDMGVVLAETTHPHQAGQTARGFIAINLTIFRQAHRQIAIGPLVVRIDHVVVRAVHRAQIVFLLVDHDRRIHVVRIERQMPRAVIELALGDVRRGDAAITGAVLGDAGELFQLVADHITRRQPHGQASAHFFHQREQAQLLADLAVIALGLFFQAGDFRLKLVLGLVGQGVNPLQLGVLGVAAPIGASDGAQLELAHLAGMVHMRATAQIDEIAGAIEGDLVQAFARDGFIPRLLGDGGRALVTQQFQKLDFEVLAFLGHVVDGFIDAVRFAIEFLFLLAQLFHALLDLGQILDRQRLFELDVIVKPCGCRRTHAKLGVRPEVLDRRSHQVSCGVTARLYREVILRHDFQASMTKRGWDERKKITLISV